jgi:subtilisin family serine protease
VRRRLLILSAFLALAGAGTAQARVDAYGDPLAPQEWWLTRVDADQATPPGPGVPIAIIDSGVDPTHPDFANRPNTTFLNDQTTFGREEYHGTAVASVAAGADNGVDLDGVYPQAALLIWDASPSPLGITDFSAVTGIQAAAQHCPAVINLSFGSTDPDSQLQAAILDAVRRGCFVVAAAGNSGDEGSPATYPAAWPHVFTVGATDQNDAIAPFSTSSPAMDVVAPGVNITADVPATRSPNGYQTSFDGTSFSAPIVSAAAAWLWTMRPTLTVSQVGQILRSTAHDLGPPGFDPASGYGLIDIPAALAAPTPPNDPFEPNDDISQVKPGMLFQEGQPPLTTPAKPTVRLTATLDAGDDPRDVYRIWVPAKKYAYVAVAAGGKAAARLWGPKTSSTHEGVVAQRRDLDGPRMYGGLRGTSAYVEVLLTGRSPAASYTLTVTVAKK